MTIEKLDAANKANSELELLKHLDANLHSDPGAKKFYTLADYMMSEALREKLKEVIEKTVKKHITERTKELQTVFKNL